MKQDQKKQQLTVAATLMAILAVGQAEAGLAETLVTMIWNQWIFMSASG